MPVTPLSTQIKAARKHDKKNRKKTKEELRSENYRRQMETLFEKVDRMVSSFGVDISLHVRRNNKQKLYTSSEDLSWPAGVKDVVVSSQFSSMLPHIVNHTKANSYPIPPIMTPSSFEAYMAKKRRKRGIIPLNSEYFSS
jgi:hypothetical protein